MGSGIDSWVDFVIRWWSKTIFGFFQCTHAVTIPTVISSISADALQIKNIVYLKLRLHQWQSHRSWSSDDTTTFFRCLLLLFPPLLCIVVLLNIKPLGARFVRGKSRNVDNSWVSTERTKEHSSTSVFGATTETIFQFLLLKHQYSIHSMTSRPEPRQSDSRARYNIGPNIPIGTVQCKQDQVDVLGTSSCKVSSTQKSWLVWYHGSSCLAFPHSLFGVIYPTLIGL
jgi:hypothetical protein